MKAVTAKKRLGQHFLVDLSIAKDIADTVDICPGMPVLEVGPGMFPARKATPDKGCGNRRRVGELSL